MKKLIAILALASSVIMAPLTAFADEVTLNAVTFTPKKAGISRGFKMFIDDINDKFKGEFQIKWRGGPEVSPSFGQAEAVRKGALDMTFTSPSYYQGLVPTSATINLSYKNYDEMLKSGYYERTTQLHADHDLVFLGELPATDVQFYIFLKDKIKSLDDLKGLRIRVFPSLVPIVKALGATPIVLPQGEVFTAMERGTIDGFMNGKIGWSLQYKGIVKEVITPGVYRAGFPILVNKDAWAKVPADLQKRIIDYIRTDLAPRVDKSWDEYIAKGDKEMAEAGFHVHELQGAEREKLLKISLDSAWAAIAEKADKGHVEELKKMLVD